MRAVKDFSFAARSVAVKGTYTVKGYVVLDSVGFRLGVGVGLGFGVGAGVGFGVGVGVGFITGVGCGDFLTKVKYPTVPAIMTTNTINSTLANPFWFV